MNIIWNLTFSNKPLQNTRSLQHWNSINKSDLLSCDINTNTTSLQSFHQRFCLWPKDSCWHEFFSRIYETIKQPEPPNMFALLKWILFCFKSFLFFFPERMKTFRNVVTQIVVLGLLIGAFVASSDESCPLTSNEDNSVGGDKSCSAPEDGKSCGCGSNLNRQENDSPSKYSEASNVDVDKETIVEDDSTTVPLNRPENVDFVRRNQMVFIKGN